MKNGTIRKLAPYTLILLMVLCFYRSLLFSNAYRPFDLPGWHLPQATFASESLRQGSLPLWDPYTYAGTPFSSNIQTQVFYPLRWPTLLLGQLSPPALLFRLELEIIFHVFLAGVFTFLLARRIGLAVPPAILAGAVFSLGCYFPPNVQDIGRVEAMAWMPLCWLCVVRLRHKLTIRWFALLSFALGMTSRSADWPCLPGNMS